MKKYFGILLGFQLMMLGALAQTKDISGAVTNDKSEAVAGATVTVKGTTTTATTDDNGAFGLKSVTDTAVLVISAEGYQPAEVNVADKTTVAVVLQKNTGTVVINNNSLFFLRRTVNGSFK